MHAVDIPVWMPCSHNCNMTCCTRGCMKTKHAPFTAMADQTQLFSTGMAWMQRLQVNQTLARDQFWTTPVLWPQGLMQTLHFTQVSVWHCDCRWLFLWPLLGMQGCPLNHSQKGTPQLRNSHTGLGDEALTLLGLRSNLPGYCCVQRKPEYPAALYQSSACC